MSPSVARALKELVVEAKNQPGEVNKIAETLGKNGVNMLAVCAYNVAEKGRIHFVVSDHEKGQAVLKKMKYTVSEGDVIILTLQHSPGELARVTGLLAGAGINIDVLYGSGSSSTSAQLILGVSDLKKAQKLLAQ